MGEGGRQAGSRNTLWPSDLSRRFYAMIIIALRRDSILKHSLAHFLFLVFLFLFLYSTSPLKTWPHEKEAYLSPERKGSERDDSTPSHSIGGKWPPKY